MKFNELPDRKKLSSELAHLATGDQLPHAILFLGPEGNGGLALATAFAQFLLCHNPQNDSCGQCRNCKRVNELIHPDVHYTFPVVSRKGQEGLSKEFYTEWRSMLAQNPFPAKQDWMNVIEAENKLLNINKNECAAIIREMNMKAFEADRKIQIIWLPEYLKKEGNRLLKLIEEPPANTLFFLVAENTEQILPTIISRCQIMYVPLLSDEAIAQHLKEKWSLDDDKTLLITQVAEGNISTAYRMVDGADNQFSALFRQWMRLAFVDAKGELIALVEELAGLGRERQKQFLLYGLQILRKMLHGQVGIRQPSGLSSEELAFVQKMGHFLSFDSLEAIIQLLNDQIYLIERNANPKILFLDATFQIRMSMKSVAKA